MEDFECASSSCDERDEKAEADQERKKESYESPELFAVLVGSASSRQPVLLFSATAVRDLPAPLTHPIPGPFRLAFKMSGESVRIVRTILFTHGFTEVPMSSSNFNMVWIGGVAKPHIIRQLRPHQKINHFPRCTELTRKDKLCENVRRMQNAKGTKHFNIIPTTFILPGDANRFIATYRKQRGTWIVKPSTLSRGRGISLINHPNQLPRTGEMVVSKYIENPLCIDGFKFDLRLYVAITSYDPLRIYLYEEGLTRFATVRYEGPHEQLDNRCMHLTNYSVNKHSVDYVACTDPNVEDYGNKWSLSALLRHLHEEGINVTELMMRVEDVIIKTILCSEEQIASACRLFMPHRGCCFEMFGFDVLIDDTLCPWVLEVNLSPSLACDAPLDLRIKSNLISDLFSLAGVPIRDPVSGDLPKAARKGHGRTNIRPSSVGVAMAGLTSDEAVAVRETKEEYARRGSFVRIFPTEDSWALYGSFLDSKSTLNYMLHKQLYPHSVRSPKPTVVSLSTVIEKRLDGLSDSPVLDVRLHEQPTGLNPLQRTSLYTKKLTWYSKLKSPHSFSSLVVARQKMSVPRKKGVGESHSTSTTDVPGHVTDPVDHVISNVTNLSKFQVRQIFASYLECVQKRLVRETRSLASIHTAISAEDQSVDVVVNFLKKASANLRAPFTVIIPNHKLPLRERRRMLAKQLAEFVMLYRKETLDVASHQDLAKSGPTLSSEVLKSFLQQASEEDFERALGTYAKQNHSSTVFLDSSTGPVLTTPTSSAPSPPPSDVTRTSSARKLSVGDLSHRHTRGRTSSEGAAIVASSVKRHESAVSAQSMENEKATKRNFRSNPVAPTRYSWINEQAAEDDGIFTATAGRYSNNMLKSSDLPLSSKMSLEKLTHSLQTVDRMSSSDLLGRRREVKTRSSLSRLSPHKRSLSVQSLASTASSVDSDLSEMAGHRVSYPSGGSHYSTSSVASLTRSVGRPKSASVIVSKEKPYVSPYAQSVLRPKQKTKVKTTKNRMMPHPPLHPASSVESIAHALTRLTQRQNARKYAAGRPVMSALKAASQPNPESAQPLPHENSKEQRSSSVVCRDDNINFDVTAGNSNNSNSRDFVIPFPSYGTNITHDHPMSSKALESYTAFWKSNPLSSHSLHVSPSPSYVQPSEMTIPLAGESLSLSTVIRTNSERNHNNVSSSTFHLSSNDHYNSPVVSVPSECATNNVDGETSKSKNRHFGTPASLDLIKRIHLHNKAISHYIDMQKHSPGVCAKTCVPHSPPMRTQPTPSTSSSHPHTGTPAPSFKFVVPHPPSTPKPNFILRPGHRGPISTTSISM